MTDDIIDLTPIQQAPEPEKKAFEPLEPGTYQVTIIDAEKRVSSQKKTPSINIRAEIATGNQKGRLIFDDWWLTEGAKAMLRDRLGAVGIDMDNLTEPFRVSDLIGRHALVGTYIEDWVNGDGTTSRKAKVRWWKADDERPNDGLAKPAVTQSADIPF